MRSQLLYPVMVITVLMSCSPVQVLTSGIKQSEINDMAYFKPQAAIGLITKGNNVQTNDSLTAIAAGMQENIVHSLNQTIHVTADILPNSDNLARRLEAETYTLIDECSKREIVKDIPITPLVDSLLEQSGKRYGLITLNVGFTRMEDNYTNQQIKFTAIGLLSLGMFDVHAVKSNSTIFTVIADAKENHLVFYGKTSLDGKEPLDSTVLIKQMKKTFSTNF